MTKESIRQRSKVLFGRLNEMTIPVMPRGFFFRDFDVCNILEVGFSQFYDAQSQELNKNCDYLARRLRSL